MIEKGIHIKDVIDQKFLIAFSQQCYQQMSDLSGTEFTAGQLSDLEQAACDLIDSLPQAYQDSFAVLDYGFYLHNRSMDHGVEDIWQEVIQEADAISPYYLLLGRVPGREGEVKVEVKMPGSLFFSCFDEQTKNYFESVTSHKGMESISDLVIEMVATMEKLADEIKKWEACCGSNLKSESCVLCPDNISEFRDFLENNGFISAPITSLSYSENDHQTGVVHALYDMSCTLPDGSSVDINLDVETYLNSIATKVEGIKGNIAHYDPANLNCTDVLEWVNGIPSVALQGNPNTTTKNKTSKSSQNRYLLKMDVITTEDEGGNVEVHMRSSEDLGDLPECDVGTIFIINVDAPELDMSEVRHYLDTFWKVLLVDSTNNLTPSVLDLDYLSISQLRDLDAISVIGNDECEIYQYCLQNYSDHDPFNFMEDILSFANSKEPLLMERGDAGKQNSDETPYLSVVSNAKITNTIVDDLACGSKEEAVAFFIFHANGHNAGIIHCGLESCVRGYMSYGSCIMLYLKNNGNYRGCYIAGYPWAAGDPYDNLYQVIIHETENKIRARIAERFFR